MLFFNDCEIAKVSRGEAEVVGCGVTVEMQGVSKLHALQLPSVVRLLARIQSGPRAYPHRQEIAPHVVSQP